jgi:hypothetical protein
MTRIDENQEVIARIRLALNCYLEHGRQQQIDLDHTDGGVVPPPIKSENHWAVGARLRRTSLHDYEETQRGNPAFRQLAARLVSFFQEVLAEESQLSLPFSVSRILCDINI